MFSSFVSLFAAFEPGREQERILAAQFSGVISPVSAEFLIQSIDKANREDFGALIIQLDTPGGLDSSMREIIKSILASKKPVVLFVSPSGARAASAGVFIAMASHVAAMAPGTNIGAAHPVMLGGAPAGIGKSGDKEGGKDPMEDKILNDASAYMKSITQQRGRNVEWAIKAVTKSDSISAEEALKMRVVDFIAKDMNELILKIDGAQIPGFGTLRTKNAEVVYNSLSRRQKWLAAVTDPNIAMILMSLGAAGLFIELYNPGLILPGVVGAVSLVIAFYSFQTLSANYAGMLLMLLGMIFFIAEIKVISYGLLSVGGIISILLGALMLFKTPGVMGLSVSLGVIAVNLLIIMAAVLGVGWIVLKAQRNKVVTGLESIIGRTGIAKTVLSPSGKVLVSGELWDAESADGSIPENAEITVEAVNGFKLKVRKAETEAK